MLSSLFMANKTPKQLNQVYTKYRNLSMPTVSNRSLYVMRCVFFNEEIDEKLLIQIMDGELNSEDLINLFKSRTNAAKMKVLKSIAYCNNQSTQKALA